MIIDDVKVVRDGFRFPEGLSWHDGSLWFSDMHAGEVFRHQPDIGRMWRVLDTDDLTSGLDWLPDGTLLVSSMGARHILAVEAGEATVWADLSSLTPYLINDLFRDPISGRCFIGDFGYRLYEGDAYRPGSIFGITPDGAPSLAAARVEFPNTAVILPGTRTMVLPETFGANIIAFDVSPFGDLSNRRSWAALPSGVMPDGCCVDTEGALWVATLAGEAFVRIEGGGRIVDTVRVPGRLAIDCVLGGDDGRTLFMATADDVMPAATAKTRRGAIEAASVSVSAPGFAN